MMLADVAEAREWAYRHIALNDYDFTIGPEDNPQARRWFVIPRNPVSNLYIQQFLRSDDDRALHDDPWDNRSWILDGEYIEHTPGGSFTDTYTTTRYTGDVVDRIATAPHRIELVTGPVLSLFFTGPIQVGRGFE